MAIESGPLMGVRVLDFGRVLAAPHTAKLMTDMGADVIHIERPLTGDDTRSDPYVYEPGLSAMFFNKNWGKRSLSIDLQHAAARGVIERLVNVSDVVIENFRPGVMKKLGLAYDDLSSINPRLIMCSISAYGQSGPYGDRVGYGHLAEAVAGLSSLSGEADGPPMPSLIATADNMASGLALGAICATLYQRERTGKGRFLDISLLDAAFQMDDIAVQHYLATNGDVKITRRGLRDETMVPWGYFEGADGWVCIISGNEAMWPRLVKAIDREDLLSDPRYSTNALRIENRESIYETLATWVRSQKSVDHVVEFLSSVRIPCARVNEVEQAVHDPQVTVRQLLVDRVHPTLGPMRISNPYSVNFLHTTAPGYAPFLGEHSRTILRELAGLKDDEVAELEAAGVIYVDPRSLSA